MSDKPQDFDTTRVAQVMTSPVATLSPDDSARDAAETMLRLKISGLPVVDGDGKPLGVVSEGDFRLSDARFRQNRREAWVHMLSGGQDMAKDYLDALDHESEHVRQIMASPAICVDETASVGEAADLMTEKKIKRVVVLRAGKVVGVVTRADLLRFFAPEAPVAARPLTPELFDAETRELRLKLHHLRAMALKKGAAEQVAPPPPGAPTAAELKAAVGAFERDKDRMKAEAHRQAKEKRDELVKDLLGEKFSDAEMSQLMTRAREAARHGESGTVALTFPAALCSDGGRTINLPDPAWPASLRGKAADFFLRWDKELRPLGFALGARIASFPDGFPGDAELSLVWGH